MCSVLNSEVLILNASDCPVNDGVLIAEEIINSCLHITAAQPKTTNSSIQACNLF